MALFAIGDLHLSLGGAKPMDIFCGWDGYVEKLQKGFEIVKPDDTVVLCGDLTWAMSLPEAEEDFRFVSALPGKKILLKGNHDYWFTTVSKAKAFFELKGFEGIDILNNNFFPYTTGGGEDIAICGTRGWLFEENLDGTHNGKIMAREVLRLKASLEAAGDREKLCFFHYPPRFKDYVCTDIVDMMRSYGAKRCWYGHIHGHGHRYAVTGWVDGIEYNMVSADFVEFTPQIVCI
ncbi:MAG: serine/threonine protein phosphatase [Clostridiales bacterium]|nr:serine/threonine protein phosphatase [Clostridiales bacterium]